jgi:formate dehydrogenase
MPETRTTFCRICESLCGLEVDVEGGRITGIRPDPEHVVTEGFGCVKGLKQHHFYQSPDRLRHPLKRVGERFERVSWEQALAEIGEKVKALRGVHPDAISMYVGTAAGFSVLHPIFAQGFMDGIGSRNMYASATQDCANKFAVARHLYGFPFTQPFPDVDRTGCLIIVGANPVVSKWSFLQVSNPMKRLREIEARGGRVFVVDPRRTETAKAAGEHVFIRPDTDVFFYLSFLDELVRSGGVDAARVAEHTTGLETLAALARDWPAERTAPVTGIPAERLREMVTAYRCSADGAALYSSTGVNMGTNGSLCFWIQEAINAVSGNLDRPGGTFVGQGIFDFAKFGVRHGVGVKSDRSRVGDFGKVNDGFPGGILADEILTPGERQIRALFVTGGNPLITMANAERMKRAFQELELLVVTDIFLNETASLAHYVLPATSPMERPDLIFLFPLFMGMQSRRYLQATERVVPADGEQRDEATIYLELARACGVSLFGSAAVQRGLELAKRVHARRHPGEPPAIPQKALLSLLLRVTGNGGFDALLREPHGRPLPPQTGGDFLGRRVVTDDGKVHLAPPELVEQARKLEADFERERADDGRLRLITKRHVKTHNSWTHNDADFVSGTLDTNHLYVHPLDAERVGLADGDLADVTSDVATVRVPVRLLDDLMPGTVALPHGWGHQHARGLSVASKTRGVNVNLLAADGPDRIERVSGMARLTGIPVEVRPAAGPQATDSWSGLPGRPSEPR